MPEKNNDSFTVEIGVEKFIMLGPVLVDVCIFVSFWLCKIVLHGDYKIATLLY